MEKILELAEKTDKEVLVNFLDTLSEKELSSILKKSTSVSEDVGSKLFRSVLQGTFLCTYTSVTIKTQGSPCTSDPRTKRKISLYKDAIGLIHSGDLTPKLITEWIGQLLLQADSLPASGLLDLSTTMIELLKSRNGQCRRWLELFPKVITSLGAKDVVVFAGSEMTGARCKGHVVNSLCSSKWSAEDVIHLAAMFRDMLLTSDELRFVVEKLLRMLKDIELQEIPPLVYQLLLLSTKGNKRQVLEGIISFFNAEEEKCKSAQMSVEDSDLEVEVHSKEEVYHTEGTVILHFTFAMKQDQDLGREFIKFLKAGQQTPGNILTPFTIALGLSIGRANRFEEPIFECLKCAINKSFKEIDYHKNSVWIREIIPCTLDIYSVFTDAVKNSTYDWDYVTQGFVELGFALMDSAKKPVGRKANDTGKSNALPVVYSPGCALGMKILLNTFKSSDIVRSDILEQILNQVITKATAPAAHYLTLLAQIVQASPVFVLDSVSKIQQVLDYLALLPVATAQAFMKAIRPLLRINMALKDSLMIVLRKAMFSRHLESRKIAATGFLLFLKYFKVIGGLPASQQTSQSSVCSQVFAEIHTTINTNANEALCLELLGTLRRSLTQQAEVRILVYEGLTKVLSRNRKLRSCILNMLLTQLKPYYESNKDVNPPLKLEPVMIMQGEVVVLQEPLAHLLQCIQQCLHQSLNGNCNLNNSESDDLEEFEHTSTDLVSIMESLSERMASSELEDFELDKSADYNTTTSVGSKNNTFATLVLGVYEVLIEYTLSADDISDTAIDQVLALFKNYRKLSSILKDKGNSGASGKKNGDNSKKSGRPSPIKLLKSLFSLKMAATMITRLLLDSNSDKNVTFAPLRENHDFVSYIVGVVSQKVQQVKDGGMCDGPEGSETDKIFSHLCQIAKVTFCFYNRESVDSSSSSQASSKTAHLPSTCLDNFSSVISVICSRYSDRLGEFLTNLEPGKNSTRSSTAEKVQNNDRIWMHVRKLQRCVTTILSESEDDFQAKHLLPLLTTIIQLSSHLVPGSEHFANALAWVQKLCTEHSIDDNIAVKALMQLYFNLLMQTKGSGSVVTNIAQDMHCRLGDIDGDVEVEDTKHYAVITAKNSPAIAQLLMQHIDQSLIHVDWILSIMKADLGLLPKTNNDEELATSHFEQKEKKVCGFLGTTITAIHELVQTALPVGPCIESLLKLLNHLYTTIALLVKYYIAVFALRVGHLCPRFEKLVKLSGTHLTPQVYSLITYIQSSQTEQSTQLEKKKKRNDGISEKAKVLRETRLIPTLIFGIEEYEKYLIQLTKKSKVNLMENIKLSTSRDFRINMQVVQAAMEQQSSDDEATTVASDHDQAGEEQENQPPDEEPPAKRTKTTKPATARKSRSK